MIEKIPEEITQAKFDENVERVIHNKPLTLPMHDLGNKFKQTCLNRLRKIIKGTREQQAIERQKQSEYYKKYYQLNKASINKFQREHYRKLKRMQDNHGRT